MIWRIGDPQTMSSETLCDTDVIWIWYKAFLGGCYLLLIVVQCKVTHCEFVP